MTSFASNTSIFHTRLRFSVKTIVIWKVIDVGVMMSGETMQLSVIAHVLDVQHNDEEVYLSCFNSEVERSFPAMKLPMHSGT